MSTKENSQELDDYYSIIAEETDLDIVAEFVVKNMSAEELGDLIFPDSLNESMALRDYLRERGRE